ncbi:MAG: YqiA/YcfP family alpha/beta fold hydrolase, partial [Chloroflexota bacterium]
MKPNIIYLHGFASSPQSQKAQAFKRGFAAREIDLVIPDLNRPDFETLTLTAMLHYLADVVRSCPPGPVYLIGSSMGGLLAVHFVHRYREAEAKRVELLFLLAPALDFIANRNATLSADELQAWEQTGWLT